MRSTILLFCLLGSTRSLPQLKPALGLPPTKLAPDQGTLPNQQQSNQVFPSLSLIPLTQMLTLGPDLHLLNPAAGMTPGTQTHPLTLGGLNVQQQLHPHVLPIFVTQLGAQVKIMLNIPQIFTSLIIHSLFPGGILPTSQAGANPDVQDGSLPAGGAGVNPATQGTPAGRLPTPSGTDDDFAVTTPADIQRSTRAIEEATTESANGIQ
uniref:Amelotin n=1 Tax=Pan paniscus TaxID=9597 RepID=A0A2R9C3N3_PANPA